MTSVVPVTVVVPTLGRVELLNACLASIARCEPKAEEILVIDQSGTGAAAKVAQDFVDVRVISCDGIGVSLARNLGLTHARHEIILVTDDDCTVAPGWVEIAWARMAEDRRKLITGRVLPVGEREAVPSIKDDPHGRDYTGTLECGVLYPNNMVLDRRIALTIGGFDDAFSPAEPAEDNDFCYRWLRAGLGLVYEPALVVWHHEWRSRADLEQLYVAYGRGQGFFYAKHLKRGDLRILRFLLRDLLNGARSLVARAVGRRTADPRLGLVRGLPAGLVRGWRAF